MNIRKIACCLSSLALIVGLIACENKPADTDLPVPKAQSSHVTVEEPLVSERAANSGTVLETMNAGSYTYIRLDNGLGGEIWAAVPETTLEIGEEITLNHGAVMRDFTSKSLDRKFESILFSSGFRRGSEAKTGPMAGDATGQASAVATTGSPQQPSAGSAGAIAPFAELKVEKSTAENGYTVGELYAGAARLNKQRITVKGQVVKISPNIMGKNWIHLQDGTGDPTKNTHDLVVTSSVMVEKGATVSLEGILATDKNFGAGYSYAVVIEEAIVAK
ncbi:MAG: hypothetical protein V3S89_10965 [Desulfobacterales bacterium]